MLIPCYRDPECVGTVLSLFEAASRPHLIYVGVILQDVFPSAIEANMLELRIPRIRLLHMYYQRARGPGYARSLGAQLYAGTHSFCRGFVSVPPKSQF